MRARRSRAACAAWLVLALGVGFGRPVAAWDAAWAIRPDADVIPFLQIQMSATIPLSSPPREVHGLGGMLSGGVLYIDDDKVALLRVAELDYTAVYRESRQRYDAGSFPAASFFDLDVQLRLRQDFHLLYGVGLTRGGVRTHAGNGGLAFHLGWALPLRGRQAESMREYQQAHLQLECIPLAGSLLADLTEEGYFEQEMPRVQLVGEVGINARLQLRRSTLSADARLSFSYLHQHSFYFLMRLRWVGPAIFRRRLRPVLDALYVFPARAFRGHIPDEGEQLLYSHHLQFSVGILVRL